MPSNKDLKRLVRTRMRKTGESYTAARARIVAKRPGTPTTPLTDPATLAGMSDAAVRAKTGRTWNQWTRVLDASGAAEKPHRDIARYLCDSHGLAGWWAQTVTVGYERIRGLRAIGQRRGGGYEAHKSRTFPVAIGRLYAAFATAAARDAWLAERSIVARKSTEDKSIRWTWPDGTSVEILFYAKGAAKSQVVIQHRKLPARDAAERMKAFWESRLGALGATLGAAGGATVTGMRRGTVSSRHPSSRSRGKTATPTRR